MSRARPKFSLDGGRKPAPPPGKPPSDASPAPAAPAGHNSRPVSRRGKRVVGTYVNPDAWMQLRILGLRSGRSTQDLMLDAIDLLFQQHGLTRIARDTPADTQD